MPIGPWSVNAESAVEYRLRQRIAALEAELAQARAECERLRREVMILAGMNADAIDAARKEGR